MYKFGFSRSTVEVVNNNLVNFTISVLALLFIFNLGWLVMLVKVYSRSTVVLNFNQAIFNLEFVLLLGNLGIFILFITYVAIVRSLKSILGRQS